MSLDNGIRYHVEWIQLENLYEHIIIMVTSAYTLVALYIGTLAKNTNPLKQEYNKTIKIITGKLWNINQISNAIFNGFELFETKARCIMAKASSKLLKCHNRSGLHHYKQQHINKIRTMLKELKAISVQGWIEKDADAIIHSLSDEYSNDMMIRWYIHSAANGCDDSLLHEYMIEPMKKNEIQWQNVLNNHYIPRQPPAAMQFIPCNNQWKDEMMEPNHIYFSTDGSIHYDDKNMQVYGIGGGGISIYYNYEKIEVIMMPISTRTLINVPELLMLNIVMDYITDERWIKHGVNTAEIECINIIADSQNAINLIQVTDHTQDEVLAKILQQITDHYDDIANNWKEASIKIYWVHSHDKSKINADAVDIAKIASQLLQITGFNGYTSPQSEEQTVTALLSYECISYQQMKKVFFIYI